MTTPASGVHVTGTPLAPLGVLHKLRYHSRLVLDITERPGLVTARGSLAAVFSRFEPLLLKLCRRWTDVTTVVTTADVEAIRGLGFARVVLVRNAPLREWSAPFRPPPPCCAVDSLVVVAVGSVFEGRGYELMLRALAEARARGNTVRLRCVGPARSSYLDSLQALAESLGVSSSVEWAGAIGSSEVSETYLDSHVGLVTYEPSDHGNDGLSNKLMECVATGRPVVASDLPENRQFVTDNRVGWLVPADARAMADVFDAIREYPDLEGLAAHCRRLGEEWLNWETEFEPVVDALGESGLGRRS